MRRLTTMSSSTPSTSLCFYSISDFGERNKDTKSVAAAMDRYARTIKLPSFILGLGDNFYPYGVEDTSDRQFQTTWRDTFLCYPSLQVPWKMVLGNHDYMGKPQAQVEYHYDKIYNPDQLWHMPDRCYEFSHTISSSSSSSSRQQKAVESQQPPTSAPLLSSSAATPSDAIRIDFFALDTNGCQGHVQHSYPYVRKQLTDDIQQLSQRLQASKAHWKIVFGHHPLYTQGLGHSFPAKCLRLPMYECRGRGGSREHKRGFDLERHLVEGGVNVYLAGHEHVFQYHHRFGLHNVCCGASGAEIRPGTGLYQGINYECEMDWKGKASDIGFVVVEIFAEHLTIRYVDLHLNILKEVTVYRAEQHVPMMPASTLPDNIFSTAMATAQKHHHSHHQQQHGNHKKKN